MGYATISLFRKLTNQTKEFVSDDILGSILPLADRLVNKLISTRIALEILDGNIDGSNKDFRTKFAPICDTNLKNVTLVDSCDVITGWTKGDNGDNPGATGRLVYGSGAVTLPKDATDGVTASWTKTLSTAVDGTGRRLKLSLYIKDTQVLGLDNAFTIRIGIDSSNYYSIMIDRKSLKNGINELDFELNITDMGLTGTVALTSLVYLYIAYDANLAADTVAAGQIIMDYWRLEDIDSADASDVEVFYATEDDSTGWRELGSKQAVSSIQDQDGIIVMTTAPTTTTAEAGVYGSYSYVSRTMDWNLVNSASCYMAAHIASFIISGNAPNFKQIEDSFARRDIAGAPDEWLRLALSILINAVGEGPDGIGFRRVETRDLT